MLRGSCQAKEGQHLLSDYSDLCLALVFGAYFLSFSLCREERGCKCVVGRRFISSWSSGES